jgi:hypothetical protein
MTQNERAQLPEKEWESDEEKRQTASPVDSSFFTDDDDEEEPDALSSSLPERIKPARDTQIRGAKEERYAQIRLKLEWEVPTQTRIDDLRDAMLQEARNKNLKIRVLAKGDSVHYSCTISLSPQEYKKFLADIPHQKRTESAESDGVHFEEGTPDSLSNFYGLGKVLNRYFNIANWAAHRQVQLEEEAVSELESIVSDLFDMVKLVKVSYEYEIVSPEIPKSADCQKGEPVANWVRTYCEKGIVNLAILMSIEETDDKLLEKLNQLCQRALQTHHHWEHAVKAGGENRGGPQSVDGKE